MGMRIEQFECQGNATLFDEADTWKHEPKVAFLSLLKSDTGAFLRTNIAKRMLPDGHKMREQSMLVYLAMFSKYLDHLSRQGSTFFDATAAQVDGFMLGALEMNTKETAWRYLRLLERVYAHLVHRGFLETNAVSEWVAKRISAGESPRIGKESDAAPVITQSDVDRIQDWLYTRGSDELAKGNWRAARDLTLSSVSLGTGMRCAELIVLRREQVKHWPGGPPKDRFEFNIPGWASVATSKAHSTPADISCVGLTEMWWSQRWCGFSVPNKAGNLVRTVRPDNDLVFPGTLAGSQLDPSTLFKNLKRLAKEGLDAGVLDQRTRWVLSRGAQGLRRAYAVTELQGGAEDQLVSFRLGLHRRQSIRRYRQQSTTETGFAS